MGQAEAVGQRRMLVRTLGSRCAGQLRLQLGNGLAAIAAYLRGGIGFGCHCGPYADFAGATGASVDAAASAARWVKISRTATSTAAATGAVISSPTASGSSI